MSEPPDTPGLEASLLVVYHRPIAAGEVSRWKHLVFDATLVTLEQWRDRSHAWKYQPVTMDFGALLFGHDGKNWWIIDSYGDCPAIFAETAMQMVRQMDPIIEAVFDNADLDEALPIDVLTQPKETPQ